MSVHEHLAELHGLPVHDFGRDTHADALPETGSVAWRLSANPYDDQRDEDFFGLYERFQSTVGPAGVRALVIGQWGEVYHSDSAPIVERLAADRAEFPSLEAFFLGDVVMEEAEISWIEQSDVTPVLTAYPGLKEFGARGGTNLRLEPFRHDSLQTLTFEAGGLPGGVVRALAASELPALHSLELWLGVQEYGGDATVADLAPILTGGRLPALRHLGLKNSEIQDEIAAAVSGAPVVAQLDSLSLSMGVLTDPGAEALIAGQPLTHLRSLDLSHHFLSDGMMRRLRDALEFAEVELDLSDQVQPHEFDDEVWRYTAVSE